MIPPKITFPSSNYHAKQATADARDKAINENVHQSATFIGVILFHRAQNLFRRKTYTKEKDQDNTDRLVSLPRVFLSQTPKMAFFAFTFGTSKLERSKQVRADMLIF